MASFFLKKKGLTDSLIDRNVFFSLFWISSVLIQFFSGLLSATGVSSLATGGIYMVLALGMLVNFKEVFQISVFDVILFLFFAFSYLGTMLFFPQNFEYLLEGGAFLPICLFYYLAGKLYKDDSVKNAFFATNEVSIVLSYLSYFTSLNQTEKNMTFAYTVLPSVIIVTYYAFHYRKKHAFVFSMLGIVLLFLLGTRGPLLFSIIYVLYCVFKYKKSVFIRILVLFTIFFVSWLYVSNAYVDLVEKLYELLRSNGIDSYILRQIVNENNTSMMERGDMIEQMTAVIFKNPFIGIGLYGDRVLLGVYVHNFFLEFISSYGIVLGSGVLMSAVALLLKLYKKVRGADKDFLVILLFSFGFRLLFSSSFLVDIGFWFSLGILCSMHRKYYITDRSLQ